MIDPEIGDYVVAPGKIYEITNKSRIGVNMFYTVRLIDDPADMLEAPFNMRQLVEDSQNTMNLSRLRHLGEIVKKEEASKAIEVLFQR